MSHIPASHAASKNSRDWNVKQLHLNTVANPILWHVLFPAVCLWVSSVSFLSPLVTKHLTLDTLFTKHCLMQHIGALISDSSSVKRLHCEPSRKFIASAQALKFYRNVLGTKNINDKLRDKKWSAKMKSHLK